MVALGKFLSMYFTVCTLFTVFSYAKAKFTSRVVNRLKGKTKEEIKEDHEKAKSQIKDIANSNSPESAIIRQLFGDVSTLEGMLTLVIFSTYTPVLNLFMWSTWLFDEGE